MPGKWSAHIELKQRPVAPRISTWRRPGAPSDYPEMAQFLVEIGIDSMSLNPDAVLRTTQKVFEIERRLGRKRVS